MKKLLVFLLISAGVAYVAAISRGWLRISSSSDGQEHSILLTVNSSNVNRDWTIVAAKLRELARDLNSPQHTTELPSPESNP